jgi:Rod binding domain-containing protein
MEPSSPTSAATADSSARRAARQLETAFAAEMIRSARPPRREGMFGGGSGARSFDSFMDEALGAALVARGGLGLARPIEEAIRRGQARGRPSRP